MRLRTLAVALLLAWTTAACGSGDGPSAATGRAADRDGAPTTLALPTTTVPAVTTTTEPDPATAKAVVTTAGVVVPVINPVGDGWVVRTPCQAIASLTRAQGRHAGSPVIVLDPGHGGPEPGAVSPSGLAEAPVNLAVARYAQEALEAEGVTTLLTLSLIHI